MDAQQRGYAEQEAKLIKSKGGIKGITLDNEQRGRNAFLRGKPYQPKQTSEWCTGWLLEYNQATYRKAS